MDFVNTKFIVFLYLCYNQDNSLESDSMQKTLWNKGFTLITLSTILSAIGHEAMTFVVSLLVFDKTQSSFLSSLIFVTAVFPDIFISLFAAPVVDKRNQKRCTLWMDVLLSLVYIGMGLFVSMHEFEYIIYILFVFIVASLSIVYRLAYGAWYPDLIPIGFEQKGYAVSSLIYPTVIIVVAPITAYLYSFLSMQYLFYVVALFTILSFICKIFIPYVQKGSTSKFVWSEYVQDLKDGFNYMKKEKGIRNICLYMSITGTNGEGVNLLTQAHYQTHPLLSVTMLATLKSAEMIGRFFGGMFQYFKEIPVKQRFLYTKFVYATYNLSDGILLFLPYPLALVNRFICGALGNVSATIRESATQIYIDPNMRARINGFYNVIFAFFSTIGNALIGLLGEVMPYPWACALLASISMSFFIILIVRNGDEKRKVYEATRAISI